MKLMTNIDHKNITKTVQRALS